MKGDHLQIRSPQAQKSWRCLIAFAPFIAPVLFLKELGEPECLLWQTFTCCLSVSNPTFFCTLFCNSAARSLQRTFPRFPCPLSSGYVLPMRDTVGRLEGAMRRWGLCSCFCLCYHPPIAALCGSGIFQHSRHRPHAVIFKVPATATQRFLLGTAWFWWLYLLLLLPPILGPIAVTYSYQSLDYLGFSFLLLASF